MVKVYEYRNGEMVEYDLGDARCPVCGWMVVGYFQNGKLVKIGLCTMCSRCRKEKKERKMIH